MSTIRGVKDRRFKFVQLLNEMFENPTLSLKAKGFIGFCLTKKENWDFHVSHLCSVLKEKDTAIYSVINECIEHGYAYRHQPRSTDGKMLPVEFVISDSKEEIATLKKEFEESSGLKKCLPQPENREAVTPQPENREAVIPRENGGYIYSNTDNSNIKNKQQQESSKNVVVVPDSPPVGDSPVENIIFRDSKGNETKLFKQDLFSECILKAKDWKSEEIQKAWEVLKNHKGFINNWFAFVDGVISNKRKTNKVEQIDIKGKTCQKTDSNKEQQSKKPHYSINGITLENVTSGRHLANWIPPWRSQTSS